MSSTLHVLSTPAAVVIPPAGFSLTPPVLPSTSSMVPHVVVSVYHHNAHSVLPVMQHSQLFYFNNFSPVHDSYSSLPLYDPNGPVLRPPSSTRFIPGYSQIKVASSSSASPHHAQMGIHLPSFLSLPPTSSTGAYLMAPNITNLVMVRLFSPRVF